MRITLALMILLFAPPQNRTVTLGWEPLPTELINIVTEVRLYHVIKLGSVPTYELISTLPPDAVSAMVTDVAPGKHTWIVRYYSSITNDEGPDSNTASIGYRDVKATAFLMF
jgi:hypothetical protein